MQLFCEEQFIVVNGHNENRFMLRQPVLIHVSMDYSGESSDTGSAEVRKFGVLVIL